ncbi:hepatitis A virus cellular receptor 1-like [Fukomys damarensis]|uniref:hepatitis A virus cellular receptor 1-like n=1 Tax=Fukomys damarensis TaxID=885580 RepID=UPI00053F8747|nr:hepatitis A virus cellular receptor 1-like [Fukomys damarensis]
MVLHLQAVALGLLLLQTGAVFSTQVSAVVGQLVTLPCTYSVSGGAVTSMCWGRGPCPRNQCSDTLIWTDGHQVTSRKDGRYRLHGQIKQGDVSLTIRNVTVGDSGQYCCRIEVPGWFNDIKRTITLSVVPATTTRAPTTSAAPPSPAHTQSHKTAPARTTSAPPTPHVPTTPARPAQTQSHKTGRTTTVPTAPHVSTATARPAQTQSHKTATIRRAPTTSHVSTSPLTPAHTQSHKTAPARTTSAPPTPHVPTTPARPAQTQSHKTGRTTTVPTAPHVSTATARSAQTQSHKTDTVPPVPTQTGETQPTILQETKPQSPTSSPDSCPTDGNTVVTQTSDGPRHNNQTQVFEAQNTWMNSDRLYIGILICSLVLLMVLVTIVIKKYFISKMRTWTLNEFLGTRPQIQALQLRSPEEDKSYIMEENDCVTH